MAPPIQLYRSENQINLMILQLLATSHSLASLLDFSVVTGLGRVPQGRVNLKEGRSIYSIYYLAWIQTLVQFQNRSYHRGTHSNNLGKRLNPLFHLCWFASSIAAFSSWSAVFSTADVVRNPFSTHRNSPPAAY